MEINILLCTDKKVLIMWPVLVEMYRFLMIFCRQNAKREDYENNYFW